MSAALVVNVKIKMVGMPKVMWLAKIGFAILKVAGAKFDVEVKS
jgi:hypothetical protein